jgi:hypothetical protein
MMSSGRYQAAVTVDDVWICYPWEAEYVIPNRDPQFSLNADL